MLTWYPLLLLSNYYFIIGRNYDIKFIYDQGHTVVGVDISHIAIEAFFDGNDLQYTVEDIEDSATFTENKKLVALSHLGSKN